MPGVDVWAELSETALAGCEGEARRRGVKLESPVEQTVHSLLRELEDDEREGTDHPIVPA